MGSLGRGCQRQSLRVGIDGHVGAARFERHGALSSGADVNRHDLVGAGERVVDTRGAEGCVDEQVGRHVGMHQRCILRRCVLEVDDGWGFFDVHQHLLRQVLGFFGGVGDDRRDRIAHVGDPSVG